MKKPQFIAALAVIILGGLMPALADAQANFYEGKTITLLATRAAGGTGDLRTRAVLTFLKKHIPGNPNIVMAYMDGGGGRKGANHLYSSVKPDGLTIGAASGTMISLAVMGESGVNYDIDKFIYLGTPEHENSNVIYTRRELGLDTIEKLRAASGLRIGAQSVGHVSYVAGRMFAYLIGLKDAKFIAGYTSQEVDAALTQGELDARANNAISVLRRNPEWLDKKLMNFHSIVEVPKGERLPILGHLPEIETFARSERERRLISLFRGFRAVGSPFILPPGTPKDRVQILEAAFRRIAKDPEFLVYFNKLVADDASPLGPEELRKIVAGIPRDPEVIDQLKQLSGAGPLPPR